MKVRYGIVAALPLLLPSISAQAQESLDSQFPPIENIVLSSVDTSASDVPVGPAFSHNGDLNAAVVSIEATVSSGVESILVEIERICNANRIDPNICLMLGPDGYGEMLKRVHEVFDPGAWPITNRWNWCGRDRTNGGPPVNSADHACMNHDNCLSKGCEECECDREFVASLEKIKNDYSFEDRAYIEAAIRAVPAAHGCQIM